MGEFGVLWETNPRVGVAIAVSFPSGAKDFVELRRRLRQLLPGNGVIRFESDHSLVRPICVHELKHLPLPMMVAVGSSHPSVSWPNALCFSPWSCPCTFPYVLYDFSEYLQRRADSVEWLSHLSGRILLCDCRRNGDCASSCWGEFLIKSFNDAFPEALHRDVFEEGVADASRQARLLACDAGGRQPSGNFQQLILDGLDPEGTLTSCSFS